MTQATESPTERQTVQSVERTLLLFELLAEAEGDVGVRELSEASGLAAGTVHRLLGVLQARGYVRQDSASRRYTVGFAAMELATKIGRRGGLRLRAQPYLRSLMQRLNETTNLAVRDGLEAVYVASEHAPRIMRSFTEIGNRVPLHATGIGKVLLAYMPRDQRDATIEKLEMVRYAPETITDRERFRAVVGTVRQLGYALDNGEYEEGVRCIAVPVRDSSGHVIAAMSVSGHSGRLTDDRLDDVVGEVRRAGDALSAALGCPAPAGVGLQEGDGATPKAPRKRKEAAAALPE
jgi:DNA-binding IclR family transcriptional regulator